MNRKKVVGFGDYLLRCNTEGNLRFLQADRFIIGYTGAEANVCVSLAHMGVPSEFVTRLPENPIADCAVSELRRHGIKTDHIVRGGERMGVFYLEKGASQRPSAIVYDRKFTSISEARPEDFDWDNIFRDASFFHLCGITAGLGEQSPEVCLAAMKKAREYGVTVSFDFNYRSKMWTREKAGKVFAQLLPYVDVLTAGAEDIRDFLGVPWDEQETVDGKLTPDGYRHLLKELCDTRPFKAVASTMRENRSASDNSWSGVLYMDGQTYFSRKYEIHLVDRIGGGDSFCAGLLYGLWAGFDAQKTVEYATAASCLKHTIEMDMNLSGVDEVLTLMNEGGSGRISR